MRNERKRNSFGERKGEREKNPTIAKKISNKRKKKERNSVRKRR